MWPARRAVTALLMLGPGLVRSAINLDGSRAITPLGDGDPSPIHDAQTYEPEQYDCPLQCADRYANMHSWTPYLSVDRLRRCQEPMLLQFSVTQPLDDPASSIFIRACTLTSGPASENLTATSLDATENPKKSETLFDPPLDSAPACVAATRETQDSLLVSGSTGSGGNVEAQLASSLLEGLDAFFASPDNCDERFVFAWHNETAASVYIGDYLGKSTISPAVKTLDGHLQRTWPVLPTRVVAQLCSSGREPERILSIAIDTAGDLAALQRMALAWSQGSCAADVDMESAGELQGMTVFEVTGSGRPMPQYNNSTLNANGTFSLVNPRLRKSRRTQNGQVHRRDTCRYIQVVSGDSCGSLASRCGISAADLYKYNPKSDFCSTLMPDDYVCCSAGDPYKPPTPQPDLDGTCATHLIQNGDTCAALAKRYHVTVDELETWNKGKAWGWTECKDMLLGYNMCISDGFAPLPPPQVGTSCGPVVPGTVFPSDFDRFKNELGLLNPCPLKACCSNWGFCGPFPAHCEIHAPAGGGPGSREKGYNSTCVSNCGSDIKINSGPPAAFQRIGYYEAYNMDRECLWLSAKRANTDGTYTHIHWAFAEIDPNGWKVVIKDNHNQWADFKALPNVKRIVAFGGWAYSTEPATYNIIREAILKNPDTFATNIAKFLNDEGLDGVDIDWEYPGATDIFVNGQPIGQSTDGVGYLAFLRRLKDKVGTNKSVSIAAPASYWYLRGFPIDAIASKIDYIVYMTYDLHGQWDYGNVHAFDACPSGKCIRSHINLTETFTALSIITKAGVPNNKIFVGEASYGRTFRMAQDGCWGPMCDFTGSKTQSDATPGRCTKTPGYLAVAEINEIIKLFGGDTQMFHDHGSNTDVLLYEGNYVSYLTGLTRDTRRDAWKRRNFAGSIDWAVDLQAFGEDDKGLPVTRPSDGIGCVAGEDLTTNTEDLHVFMPYGFCPEPHCECTWTDALLPLPAENTNIDVSKIITWDEEDVVLHRLCRFACRYGYCPTSVCTTPYVSRDDGVVTSDKGVDMYDVRGQNANKCILPQDPRQWHGDYLNSCKRYCQPVLDQAAQQGRTSNYGCMVWQPKGAPDPWYRISGLPYLVADGECSCDNFLINELADTVLEAMPIIAQIGCYIVMSAFKFVLDIGLQFVPVVGQPLSAGLDMLTTAAEMASYIYPEEQDPEGAFSWWLSPCGGTDLVPDEIKKVFGILSQVADGVSSFRAPKNIPKGSGRRGDDGNPTDRSGPRTTAHPTTNTRPTATTSGCHVPPAQSTQKIGENGVRLKSCSNQKTITHDKIAVSLVYGAAATPTQIGKVCEARWTQACYHYSSAIRAQAARGVNWATLTCVPEAATTKKDRGKGKATKVWSDQHKGSKWLDTQYRYDRCERDEYPPVYLLNDNSPAMKFSGENNPEGQLVRYIPYADNGGAGSMWRRMCFSPVVQDMDKDAILKSVDAAATTRTVKKGATETTTYAVITVDKHPEFTITAYEHAANPLQNDGLNDNPCWPSKIAPKDPGFAVLTWDPYYGGFAPPYKYDQAYNPPNNGG